DTDLLLVGPEVEDQVVQLARERQRPERGAGGPNRLEGGRRRTPRPLEGDLRDAPAPVEGTCARARGDPVAAEGCPHRRDREHAVAASSALRVSLVNLQKLTFQP